MGNFASKSKGAGKATDAIPYLDQSWDGQLVGDWRSDAAKEMDKLGGQGRPAVKRGNSMQFKLEQLQEDLIGQVEAFTELLDHDPLAGRHEIIRQEQMAAVKESLMKEMAKDHTIYSVSMWKHMPHNLLREEEAAQRAKKAAQGTGLIAFGSKVEKPQTPSTRCLSNTSAAPATPSAYKPDGKHAIRARINDYYLEMSGTKHLKGDRVQMLQHAAPTGPPKPRGLIRSHSANASMQRPRANPTLQLSEFPEWRQKVFKAKRKAVLVIGTVAKFRSAAGLKPSGPRRINSFSTFIQDHLGSVLPNFVEEMAKHNQAKSSIAQAKNSRSDLQVPREPVHAADIRASSLDSSLGSSQSTTVSGSVRPFMRPNSTSRMRAAAGSAVQQTPANLYPAGGLLSPRPYAGGLKPTSKNGILRPMQSSLPGCLPTHQPQQTLRMHDAPPSTTPGLGLGSRAQGQSTPQRRQSYNGSDLPPSNPPPPTLSASTSCLSTQVPQKRASRMSLPWSLTDLDEAPSSVPPPNQTGSDFLSPKVQQKRAPSVSLQGCLPDLDEAPTSVPQPKLSTSASYLPRQEQRKPAPGVSMPGGLTKSEETDTVIDESLSLIAGIDESSVLTKPAYDVPLFSQPLGLTPSPPGTANPRASRLMTPSLSFKRQTHTPHEGLSIILPTRTSSQKHLLPTPPPGYDSGNSNPASPFPSPRQSPVTTPRHCPRPPHNLNFRPSIEVEREQLETEATTTMEHSAQMMAMYATRCNARWAEQQTWGKPVVNPTEKFRTVATGSLWSSYRSEVMVMLKSGGIAFQIMLGDDHVALNAASSFSLWSADPWQVISSMLPGTADAADTKIQGVSMGPRLLMSLVAAVEVVAGEQALKKLHIILHCNDTQEEAVIQDLRDRNFCGLPENNVVVLAHQVGNAYVYDLEERMFVRQHVGPTRQHGSGYCMMQLMWPDEAYTLKSHEAEAKETEELEKKYASEQPDGSVPEDGIPKVPIKQIIRGTAWQYLMERGVRWLTTRQLSDLQLFEIEAAIDVEALAYAQFLKERSKVNMCVMVDMLPSLKAGSRGSHEGLVMSQMDDKGKPLRPNTVADVKRSDLATPQMLAVVNRLRSGGEPLAVSSKRYLFDLESLKDILTVPSMFNWTLDLVGDQAFLSMDVADLTTAPNACCAALTNKAPPRRFLGPEDVEHLLKCVNVQDSSAAFRKVLGASVVKAFHAAAARPAGSPAGPRTGIRAAYGAEVTKIADAVEPGKGGQRIVVLVSDNRATQVAVSLVLSIVRPTKDLVHFVTVVSSPMNVQPAMELCERFADSAKAALAYTHVDVLIKSLSPLVEQLEEYASSQKADLVVMGSDSLSDRGASSFAIGSITLSLMRTINQPLLVVKSNARDALIDYNKDKLKCVLMVDLGSRQLIKFVCSRILNPIRMDKLVLGRGGAYEKNMMESPVSRRLMETFCDVAASHHFDATKRPMEGPFDVDGVRMAEAEKAHIIAMPAPQGRVLPESILRVLKNTRSAVLVYRNVASEL